MRLVGSHLEPHVAPHAHPTLSTGWEMPRCSKIVAAARAHAVTVKSATGGPLRP